MGSHNLTLCPTCGHTLNSVEKVTVDLNSNSVVYGDYSERLPGRLAEILFVLARDAPLLVTKEKLMKDVYGKFTITDSETASMNVYISSIRKIGERVGFKIETVHGRGFRLIAKPLEVTDGGI